MRKTQIALFLFSLIPSLVSAQDITYLNFTVTNLSTTRVFFKSQDIFDFGKFVGKNETKTITYDFPPKRITVKISDYINDSYDILTSPSCDRLGWPAYRQMTHIEKGSNVEGIAIYKAGNVHITISDLNGSTINKKQIDCVISND